MAKKIRFINFMGFRIPIIGKVVDDENGEPLVVLHKDNVGRAPTRAKGGKLPKPAEDTGDGIWHHEMTNEQKKQYGFMKGTTKKGAKNED